MQETQVRSLNQEDPTCCGATRPHVPQLLSPFSKAREPQLLSTCSGAATMNPHAADTEAHVPISRAPQQETTPQEET